jgi:hypothetical protein
MTASEAPLRTYNLIVLSTVVSHFTSRRLSLIFALLMPACASCQRGAPVGGVITNPSQVTAVLSARATQVRALRAHGSADQFGRNGRVRGEVSIVVQAPDKVRFDMFAFGTLVSSLVTDGVRFGLLQGTTYAVGPARACAAQRLAGIPLEAREIAAVLTGGLPELGTPVGPVRWEDGHYVLDLRMPDSRTNRVELELPDEQRSLPPAQQTPRVSRMVMRDARGVRAEITYESYRVIDAQPYPQRVRILMQRDDVDMQVRFDRIEPGLPPAPTATDDDALYGPSPASPDLFQIAAPAGTEVLSIECS